MEHVAHQCICMQYILELVSSNFHLETIKLNVFEAKTIETN